MAKQNRELKRNMPLAEWLSRNTKEELVQMADLMGCNCSVKPVIAH